MSRFSVQVIEYGIGGDSNSARWVTVAAPDAQGAIEPARRIAGQLGWDPDEINVYPEGTGTSLNPPLAKWRHNENSVAEVTDGDGDAGTKVVVVDGVEYTAEPLGNGRWSVRVEDPDTCEAINNGPVNWANDEELSEALGVRLVFVDGGDHPTAIESIYDEVDSEVL